MSSCCASDNSLGLLVVSEDDGGPGDSTTVGSVVPSNGEVFHSISGGLFESRVSPPEFINMSSLVDAFPTSDWSNLTELMADALPSTSTRMRPGGTACEDTGEDGNEGDEGVEQVRDVDDEDEDGEE